jgi:hypothetical protein
MPLSFRVGYMMSVSRDRFVGALLVLTLCLSVSACNSVTTTPDRVLLTFMLDVPPNLYDRDEEVVGQIEGPRNAMAVCLKGTCTFGGILPGDYVGSIEEPRVQNPDGPHPGPSGHKCDATTLKFTVPAGVERFEVQFFCPRIWPFNSELEGPWTVDYQPGDTTCPWVQRSGSMPLTMHFTPPDLLIAELDGYPMPKEIAGKLKENKWSGKAPKSYQGAGITEVEKWRGVFGMELDLLAPGLDLGILSGTGKGTRDYTSSFDPSFSCTEEFELDFNYLLTSRKF